MLNFLDFLGTVGGAILGLPGILGVALGMTTRRWPLAVILGLIVGILSALLLGGNHAGHASIGEFSVSAVIGILAGATGCLIRRKGASV